MKTYRYRGVPVIGFAAYSGTGKTTIIRSLLPLLLAKGIRCAIIKHAHHDFDIDYPGKDSYELRKAGADQVLVGSGERHAIVIETRSGKDPELADFLARLNLDAVDLILVEGFRDASFPKIEVHRKSLDRELFYAEDEFIIAIVTDDVAVQASELPIFGLEKLDSLSGFLVSYCAEAKRA